MTRQSRYTCSSDTADREPLYVLALGPYPQGLTSPSIRPSWDGGPAIISAAKLAIEQVNNRTDILCDYELKIIEADSGCQTTSRALISFNRLVLLNPNNVVGIIGPGCSDATLALATLLLPERIDLVQVAISSTPTVKGSIHKNTFRTVSSTSKFVRSYIQLLEQERWNRVGVLFEHTRQNHVATSADFVNQLQVHNRSNAAALEMGVTDSNLMPVVTFKELGYRIIFVFAGGSTARNILCVAFHHNMFFPSYQFYFVVRPLAGLVAPTCIPFADRNSGSCEYSCTLEDMQRIVNGSILSEYELSRIDRETPTVSNTTFEEYDALYQNVAGEFLEELNITDTYNLSTASYVFRHVYYDAAWALALALNNSVPRLDEMGLDLSDYSYRSANHSIFTEVLKDELFALDFEGVSGRIRLDPDRRDANHTVIRLAQVCFECEDNPKIIGFFESDLELIDSVHTFIRDSFPQELIAVNQAAGTFLLVLTVLMAGVILLMQTATIYYRERKCVKATSPQFTHFIFSGTYLFLLAASLYLASSTYVSHFAGNPILFSVNCSAMVWCVSLGFTLLVGTICAKAWRIYRIFTHFKQSKIRFVSDNTLLFIILFLVLVDVVLNILWNVINQWEIERVPVDPESATTLGELYVCHCDNLIVWVFVVALYKILLTITVGLLAYVSRQIERKGFKQTRYINIVVYSFVLIFGVCAPVFIVFRISLPTFSAVILSLASILCALVTALSIFLPPLIPILKLKSASLRNKP